MPNTNPFFSTTTGYSGEVNLLDDLVREQIKMYGVDIMYMPRTLVNLDTLLHESSKSAFELAMPMPMYIKSFDGYDNGMELLTKFGVRSSDQITLVMSRSEFGVHYAPFIEAQYNQQNGGEGLIDELKGQTTLRPKEGDLIYFPFDDSVFEIKYTQFEAPFFQFGEGYVFEITVERFEFSGETFSTGIDDIDDIVTTANIFRLDFDLQAGGTSTFEQFETVTIYDVSHLETPTTDTPDPVDPFQFYQSAGFLEDVNTVTAKVAEWDITTRKLSLVEISDNDPDQRDSTDESIDVTRFEQALIVGGTSGASWLTEGMDVAPMAFDDTREIQDEFDTIKVIDPADVNPFGFY